MDLNGPETDQLDLLRYKTAGADGVTNNSCKHTEKTNKICVYVIVKNVR